MARQKLVGPNKWGYPDYEYLKINDNVDVDNARDTYVDGELSTLYSQDAAEVIARTNADAALDSKLDDILNETDLDPNKDPEVTNARDSELNGVFPTVKERLDHSEKNGTPPTFTTISEFARAINVPATVKNGHISDNNGNALHYAGLTLVNSVENGDFSEGTAGWSPVGATGSIIGNIYSLTGSGTAATPYLESTVPTTYTDSNLLFMKFRARVTNSVCTKIGLSIRGTVTTGTVAILAGISNPTINEWYDVYGIVAPSGGSGEYLIRISESYADSATANGKVMEISDVHAINMTALGIESYTEVQMLALVQGGYIDGMQSIENMVVKSVGKNLFDKSEALTRPKGFISSNGLVTLSPEYNNIFVRVVGGVNYTLVNYLASNTYWFDGNNTSLGAYSTIGSLAPVGAVYLGITSLETNIDIVQLEKGPVATTYESYQSSQATLPTTARRLPNGVADDVYFDNGKAWKLKKVEEKIVQSADITGFVTTGANVNYATMPIGNLIGSVTFDGLIITNDTINGARTETNIDEIDAISGIGKYITGATAFVWIFSKSEVPDLATAKTILEGDAIQYQLEAPVLEELATVADLELFEGGTITQVGDNGLFNTLSVEAPTNLKAVQIGANYGITANSKELINKANIIQEEWKKLSCKNGWGTELSYYKDTLGVVRLTATIASGTTSIATVICTLPVGYRPSITTPLNAITTDGSGGTAALQLLYIDTSGNVTIASTVAKTFIIINETFRADA